MTLFYSNYSITTTTVLLGNITNEVPKRLSYKVGPCQSATRGECPLDHPFPNN